MVFSAVPKLTVSMSCTTTEPPEEEMMGLLLLGVLMNL